MKAGEKFELECLDYLKRNYGNNSIIFFHHDTADSTGSDIEVFINGQSRFFIEVKEPAAQSGQFVVLSDEMSRTFVFSPRNKSLPNEMTDLMIDYMNTEYDRFNAADTAGETLDIPSKFFTKWIIGHYKEKNVRFVISMKHKMFICPIEKFGDYFTVAALFRRKKSGSKKPPEKSIDSIIKVLNDQYGITDVSRRIVNGRKKLFANAPESLGKIRFALGDFTYYLSPQNEPGLFEVKQLSNTKNRNVIFSIVAKQEQELQDLKEFEDSLL